MTALRSSMLPFRYCCPVVVAAALIVLFLFAGNAPAETGQNQLDFANGLFLRGFYDEAIDEYERYLAAGPQGEDAAIAWLRLGRCAVAVKRYDKALDAFRKSEAGTTDAARRAEAKTSAGEVLFFSGKYPEAIEALKELAGKETPAELRARALYYLGRSSVETGAGDAAVTALSTLAAEIPESPLAVFAQYHLGFAYLAGNDAEEAAKAFSAAANTEGADSALRMESRFRAAELYDKLGWTEAALGAYEQLRTEFPDSEYARRADYGYGWALYHNSRYEEAYALADAFVKEHPDSPHLPGLLYLKGSCRYQQGNYAEALEVYGTLRSKFADSPFALRALYKIAWAQHLSGDNVAAGESARAFLDASPEGEFKGETLYLIGTLAVLEGDYEQGLEEFRQVAEAYPDSEFAPEALFKSGECYAQLGLRDEAAKTFEAFARKYPDNPLTEQAMLRSGDARFTAQDFAEALANYRGILAKPSSPVVEEETLYRLAVTLHNMKDHAESAATFRQLLEKFPEGKYTAEAFFRIGEHELRVNKDALKAIEAYQAALAKKPAETITVSALQGLATARYEQKDFEQAAAQVLQLIHDYPAIPLPADAYLWCGQWLNQAERWADAAAVFTALLTAYPQHEQRNEILYVLGGIQEKAGDPDTAMEIYAEALVANPDPSRTADLHNRLGKMHEAKQEFDQAKDLYEKAANLDGGENSARARFNLASLYEAQGDLENAARNFMRLAILYVHETMSPESLWRAGNCYTRLNNPVQAKSIFEELIADYPDSPFAKEAQALLNQPAAAAPAPADPATE